MEDLQQELPVDLAVAAAGAASAASSLTIAPVLTVPIVLLALLFGVGIAVLFGLPAWRASQLNPVEALQFE